MIFNFFFSIGDKKSPTDNLYSLDSIQAQQNFRLNLDPNCLVLRVFLKDIFFDV